MQNSNDELKQVPTNEPYTYNKAQEIFNKSLTNSSSIEKKEEKVYIINPKISSKKLKLIRKISLQYLKKSLNDFSSRQPSKSLYFKALINFYKGYKLTIYSLLFYVQLKLSNKLIYSRKTYNEKNNFSKCYLKSIYPKIKSAYKFNRKINYIVTDFLRKSCRKTLLFQTILLLRYRKNLRFYSSSSIILSLFYTLDHRLRKNFNKVYSNFLRKVSALRLNFDKLELNSQFFISLNNFKTLLSTVKNGLFELSTLDAKQIRPYLERISLVISIYFIPFLFLATQALIPLIDEYEYLIINPLTSNLFDKIPFLIDLIKFVRPLITNPLFLFWVPLGYYLTFTSAYRSLQISYKTAYNGTIAAVFLIINYSCVLFQFLMNLAYQSIKMTKDIFFTSYLIKHLGKNKNKERDEALKVFVSLVNRYDSEIRKSYYDFLLILNHRVFSHLALISLVALVYNCIYYIVHNKNPEIILVTQTARATIKNPQEED